MGERRSFTREEWAAIEAEAAAEMAADLQLLANKLTARLLEKMRAEACGHHLYIPAAPKYDEDAVLASFNGRNADEVCRGHGISKATFYRILKRRHPGS